MKKKTIKILAVGSITLFFLVAIISGCGQPRPVRAENGPSVVKVGSVSGATGAVVEVLVEGKYSVNQVERA